MESAAIDNISDEKLHENIIIYKSTLLGYH